MSAQLARLSAAQADTRPDRRKVHRYAAEAAATLHSSHGESAGVLLADVSTHGCNVQGDLGWLRPGSFVSIAYGDEPLLSAVVRWMRDGAAGMEFLQPIPASRAEWHALMNASFGA